MTGHPDVSVGQESDGRVHIKFNAADPFTPALGENTKQFGVSVNGDLFYKPTADGVLVVGGTAGWYPSWEVNHYAPDGSATAVLQQSPVVDHPAFLAFPERSIGDTQLPYEFNNVFPALPGMGEPAGVPGGPHVPAIAGGIPPLIATPAGTWPLGPVASAPTIPLIDPLVLPK